MTRKVDVRKAFDKLPQEAIFRLEAPMNDDKITVEELTIQYLITDMKWTIYMLEQDLGNYHEDESEYIYAKEQLRQCKKWYSYYKRYDTEKEAAR